MHVEWVAKGDSKKSGQNLGLAKSQRKVQMFTVIGLILGIIFGLIVAGVVNAVTNKEGASWVMGTIVFLICLILGINADVNIGMTVNGLWYREMGDAAFQLWSLRTEMYHNSFFVGAMIAFVIVAVNLLIATGLSIDVDNDKSTLAIAIAWVATVVAAFVFGWFATFGWELYLAAQNAVEGEVVDPIFHLDVSFYMFQVPWMQFQQNFVHYVVLASIVATAAVYYFAERGGWAWTHLSILGVVELLVLAWGWQIHPYTMLYNDSFAKVVGVGYTAVNVTIPNLNFMSNVLLIGAGLLVINAFLRRMEGLIIAIVVAVLMTIGWLWVGPAITQTFTVGPSEIKWEEAYIKNNIEFTRRAYKLNDINENTFPFSPTMDIAEIKESDQVLKTMRIMDWKPLSDANTQLQAMSKNYYVFGDTDLDRYVAPDGSIIPVMVGARELKTEQLPQQTWSNKYIQFTHGIGFTAVRTNQVNQQGQPIYVAKDLPMKTESFISNPKHPEIYFGEYTDVAVFVGTTLPEYGRPTEIAAEPERVFYSGAAGVPVKDRLAFALYFADPNIWFNDYLKPESKILLNREIKSRVNKIMPWLKVDDDPYIVATPENFYWLMDAYCFNKYYPYANKYGFSGANYVRPCVKITVDAYNGTTTFYKTESEPVVEMLSKVAPGLFRPLSDMPDEMKKHIRYPEGFFKIQADVLLRYHVQNPIGFYNGDDVWHISRENPSGTPIPAEPRYVLIQLPSEKKPEYVLMQPLSPNKRETLVSWFVVRMDDHYGELIQWNFPQDQQVQGPMQVNSAINQDLGLSSLITLVSQKGSKTYWGNTMTIPILGKTRGTVVYTVPLFVLAEQSPIPQLKLVVVSANGNLYTGKDLEEALQNLYANTPGYRGQSPMPAGVMPTPQPIPPAGIPQTRDQLIQAAQSHYDQAIQCAARRDMTCYGREIDALGQVLQQLGPTPTPTK